jgi:hypothetical protein
MQPSGFPRMQDEDLKTFTDSFENIGKLGRQLAALQADVIAIEGLRVDDNGDAEAVVKASDSGSSNIGLRLPPSAMLTVKRKEILRAMNALKAAFNEILDHAETLSERCRAAPVAHNGRLPNVDADVLDSMASDMKSEIKEASHVGSDAENAPTHTQPPQARIGPPRLRDSLFNKRPQAAE